MGGVAEGKCPVLMGVERAGVVGAVVAGGADGERRWCRVALGDGQ